MESDRMAYTRFKGKFCNISVSVHDPTLSADDRDTFYAKFQLLTTFLQKYHMVIIGGDWNARVGHNTAAMTSAFHKHGIDRCANEVMPSSLNGRAWNY
ncbi:unnamed protein product [Dracunculus medinensis]|uniref:Endo/exonuclease/phosphatase domain-containing protein n=1 Tax=Dracunculus medinensis TaxID=318479 RepID=A0A0N4U228_DRAME|nr:unnamed protein product [Dracunculus medinensis]